MAAGSSARALAVSLAAFACIGAPCPLIAQDQPECLEDEDCAIGDVCDEGICEDDRVGPLSGAAEDAFCVRAQECAGVSNPEQECAEQKAIANADPDQACVRSACAAEIDAYARCMLDNGACNEGVFLASDGECNAASDVLLVCFGDAPCNTGEGEGEGEE